MDSRTYTLRARIAIVLCITVLASTFFTISGGAKTHGRALEGHRIRRRSSSSSVKSLNRVSSSSFWFDGYSNTDSSSYGSPFNSLAPEPSISTPSPSLPAYSPVLPNPPPPPPKHAPKSNNNVPNPSPPQVYLPPIVYPPPPSSNSPSSPHHKKQPQPQQYAVWCVAKPTVPDQIIQPAMDYACGSGADCKSIQPNGSCYFPNTMLAHASYAFNSYWQNTKIAGGTCDFGGTAMLVTVDPSYGKCNFVLT